MVTKKTTIVGKPKTPDNWVQEGGELVNPLVIPELVVQEEERKRGRPKGGKSSSPGYQRATLYLPDELHLRLKLAAVRQKTEMSELAISAISKYLDILESKNPGF